MGILNYGRYQVTRTYGIPVFENQAKKSGKVLGLTSDIVTLRLKDGTGDKKEITEKELIEKFEAGMKERKGSETRKELFIHTTMKS